MRYFIINCISISVRLGNKLSKEVWEMEKKEFLKLQQQQIFPRNFATHCPDKVDHSQSSNQV